MSSFVGKVVLITGASAGIGEGIAIHLAKLGATLSLTGRNDSNLHKVAEKCKEQGAIDDKLLTLAGELTSKEFRESLMKTTLDKFGRLDVLVNNAGMIHYARATETTEEKYDEMMDVNMRSHFFLTNLAVPSLKENKGNIINISSICGPKAMAEVAAYCMSKASMDSYTECLALELAPFGVRVNAINPGTIVSSIARRGHSKYQDEADYKKVYDDSIYLMHCIEIYTLAMDLKQHGIVKGCVPVEESFVSFLEIQATKHPLGRVGVPQDIANAVAFLASDQASFISGQILFVDGARHCVSVAVTTSVNK